MPRTTGIYRVSESPAESVRAFVPHPLPPADPPLVVRGRIAELDAAARAALAQLDLAGAMVPSTDWLLYGFVRKEAVITSQIEGTQATLQDVLSFEATEQCTRPEDVEEVCNYVDALAHARAELADPHGLPLSTRLLCATHRVLMRGARGTEKLPGEIRRTQNWIGGSRPGNAHFVPPPPDDVSEAMSQLERWLHQGDPLPALIKAGLAHVQFETIHPFLDGNGRMGRLLIALLVEHWNLLDAPILYLSLALKRRQDDYYARLGAVRSDGDWESWTQFFLECVRESAEDGVRVARELHALVERDRVRLIDHDRTTVTAIQLLDRLPTDPIVTVARVTDRLGVTAPPARKAILLLEELGVFDEITGRQRERVYAYREYLRILTGEE